MKRFFGVALVALLCAAPARANFFCTGSCPPWKFEMGGNFYIRCYQGTAVGGVLGPWYNYWPLEAHFNVPAPCAYPYWPPGQTLPNGETAAVPPVAGYVPPPGHDAPPPAPAVPPPAPPGALKPANFHGPAVQPVRYSAPVPSYWYGR
jgi:hypothetical protein